MPKAPAKKKPASTAKKPGVAAKSTATKETKRLTREVLYTDVKVQLCLGDKALTEAQAKKLMMWETETDQVKFGASYMLVDNEGKKVRCYNNMSYSENDDVKFSNRQFYPQLAKTWESEILHRRWKVNGETMIIGQTGMTLSCQHRLVGFILACQEWRKNPDKWPMWETEPTMECIIVYGIEETDEVINTIDTGKSRTLSDVIFRSELIRDYKESDRKVLAKIISYAIMTVADRTGAWTNAFAPNRTHGEMIHFLDRHPRLLSCCTDIFVETARSEGDKLSPSDKTFVSLGTAAGLMYLMSVSASNPNDYVVADVPTESVLNFDNEDLAREFWIKVIHRKLPVLVDVMGRFTVEATPDPETGITPELEHNGGTRDEKVGTLIKAWLLIAAGKKLTPEGLKLLYHVEDGIRTVAEAPKCGGIDIGTVADVIPPTAEEIAERREEVDQADLDEKQHAESNGNPTKKAVKKTAPTRIKVGDTAYVVIDAENGVWFGGEVMEIYPVQGGKSKARLHITVPKSQKDKTEEVEYEQLTLKKPE